MFLHAEKYLKSNVLQYFNLKPIAFRDDKKVLLQVFQIAFVFYINLPLKSSRKFQRKSRGSFKKMRLQNIEHFEKHFKLRLFWHKKAVDFIRPLKFGSPSRV